MFCEGKGLFNILSIGDFFLGGGGRGTKTVKRNKR